ncbi:PfkB family carbohydrate kinase [Kineococcus sp. SYSU DK005]|uniref:PfkB family carbohydrate kinase n=1 Tax=Kineococcus sp. SYSU DK005 TaxID=3383126 RepID=UPI003D7C3748
MNPVHDLPARPRDVPRVLAAGDNVVDRYPATGLCYPGGNCVNTAVAAARAGAEAAYLGAVAPDAAGDLLRAALAAEGVRTDRLRVVPGRTAHCVVEVVGGDRRFASSDPGVSRFTPDAGDLAHAAGFDAVHVGRSSGLDAWLAAFAAASRLSYDFAQDGDLDRVRRVAPLAWLATFSTGHLDEDTAGDLAHAALGAGARWVLLTRGAAGAVLTDGTGTWRVPAAPVDLVDTLGAGDAFTATVLVGLLRGTDPAAALRAAARAAARTCSRPGAFGHPAPDPLATAGV